MNKEGQSLLGKIILFVAVGIGVTSIAFHFRGK